MSGKTTAEELEKTLLKLRRTEEKLRLEQEARKRSEGLYRMTLDGLSASIAILDDQGEILFVNKAWRVFARENGIAADAVSEGINYLKVCDAADGPDEDTARIFARGIRMVLSGEKTSFSHEYHCHSPEKKRWFTGQVTPFPDMSRKRIVVSHQDITERVLSARALQKSEAHLRAIHETMPGLLWLKDPQGVYISCNPRFERFFGARESEIIGKTDYDFVDRDLADFFRSKDRAAMSADRPMVNEEEVTYADDGHKEILETVKTPMYDNEGRLIGVLGVAHDITERKLNEDKQKKNLFLLKTAFQSASDGFVIINKEDRIINWNDGAAAMFGYQAEEIIGKPCTLIMPERFRQRHEEKIAGFDHEKGSRLIGETLELVGLHKDGHEFFIELSIAHWRVGDELYFFSIIRDVSDRKKLEQALEKYTRHLGERVKELNCLYGISNLIEKDISLEEFFRRTVELIPPSWQYPDITCARITFKDQVFETRSFQESNRVQSCDIIAHNNKVGRVEIFCNEDGRATRNPFLKEEWDLIKAICQRLGDTVERKNAEKDLRAVHENLEELVRKRTRELAQKHEELIQETNGRLRAYKEKKQLEEQLSRSQKMEALGTLAGGIAHDFNNILSGIFGYSQLAEVSIGNPEKARNHIRNVVKAAQRATDLVHQILTVSRRSELQKRPLNIAIVVKEAIKLLRSTLPSTISIKDNIESREKVLAEPTQIHQVVMNLCTNAYHAMRGTGGVLTIDLREVENIDHSLEKGMAPGKYLRLDVRDTGCGMDEKILNKVFDPYFTTKEVGEGTGLGLALVYGIVQEHGGSISARSVPGKGSRFRIYLPVTDKESRGNSGTHDPGAISGGTERIMVVDDEKSILFSTRELLEDFGYKVSPFPNGRLAYDAFKQDPSAYDLIITDMTMPLMRGDELSIAVTKIRRDIPVILSTGFSDNISEKRAMEIGIKKYLQKPISYNKLLIHIRDVLDGS
ncbi:MAG: PAS domain S-box protein [Desulfobacterales bacterium]|nr:PAS domain S-box protein [Desulfobacterales bacterium]